MQTSEWLMCLGMVMATSLLLVALSEALCSADLERGYRPLGLLLVSGSLWLIAALLPSRIALAWHLAAGALGLGLFAARWLVAIRVRPLAKEHTDDCPPAQNQPAPQSRSAQASWLPLAGMALCAPILWFPQLRPELLLPAMLVCALVFATSIVSRGRRWLPSPLSLPILLLALAAGLAYLGTDDRALALPKATSFLLGLGFYLALQDAPRSVRPQAAIAVMLVMALLFASVGLTNGLVSAKIPALVQIRSQLPRFLMALPDAQNGRASMNQLGGALLLIIPVLLAWIVGWAADLERPLNGLWAVVVVGCLLLLAALMITQSRGAWVGMVAGALVLLALGPRWGKLAVAIVLIAALLLWLVWGREHLTDAIVQALSAARGPTTALGTLSLAGRLSIWHAVLADICASPWWGNGWGSLRATPYTHAHNILLQVAYDLGLPALAAYLALVLVAGRICWRAMPRSRVTHRALALGCLAALVAFHVYGMVDVVALGSKPSVLWWCLLALIGSLDRKGIDRGAKL